MINMKMSPWNHDVGWFACKTASDMEPWQHLRQSIHISKIFNRRRSPHTLQITKVRSSLHSAKGHRIERDLKSLSWVPRGHIELTRCLRDKAHHHVGFEVHALAVHVSSSLTPLPKGRLISEVNSNLAQD